MKTWNFSSVRGTIERTIPYSLSICNIELSANVLNMLRECIKPGGMGYVEELNLTRNNFQGSDGINFAIEIIQSQTKMTEFCYERNPADREQDCQRLFDAIVSHPNIIKCNLNGLFGGETNGHDYLVHLLRKDGIKNINFAGSDALQRNRTLKELELQMNEFTRLGEETLKKAIYDDSSLNAVANSNHVCEISGLRSWGFLHGVNFRVPYERSRAQKIFRLLEERNKEGTNARHLEGEMRGDTLKILPLTLAAIQIYGEYKAKKVKWQDNGIVWIEDAAPLSITYELLKSWNVPVL
ncbi:hypothetical protein THAOC_03422 [Thalassiosira oceanica]|uniref:Uncharacterized protein n=1 Tax=Thalassiosira oceanica TaxID=159749 RepID=K0TKZ2_THAOC|nr:hypothetical protein THAOC_03422 [Thalassiosira oceanica]|eukprot:EJK74876.1 hypothetical protein THAOC_03422 [Thalassiosira oceanica]